MSETTVPEPLREVLTLIEGRLGLVFIDTRLQEVIEVVESRRKATQCRGYAAYALLLSAVTTAEKEMIELARRLTIGETYFFRNDGQHRALIGQVLPSLSETRPPGPIRVLSAGCASGEEAYTIAIETQPPGYLLRPLDIVGVDINQQALARANRGSYTKWSVRATPEKIQERWFKRKGADFLLDPKIIERASFIEGNITDPDAAFWNRGPFDVIFCRNVLIYFSLATMDRVVGLFTKHLRPGGFLFLGHAENPGAESKNYHLHHAHSSFFYERRMTSRLSVPAILPAQVAMPDAFASVTPEVDINPDDPLWMSEVARASERIAELAADARASRPSLSGAWRPNPPQSAESVLKSAKQAISEGMNERALDTLRAIPESDQESAEVRLVEAIALTHDGQRERARRILEDLRVTDEFNPTLYCLLAILSDAEGSLELAEQMAETAVFLDGTSAMAHTVLGRVSMRLGRKKRAEQEFKQVRTLLACDEQAGQLALLSGGADPATVLAQCEADLLKLEHGP